MTITAEDLAKLTPFTKATTAERPEIDLLKMASAVLDATTALVEGEGVPTEKAEVFGDRVDEIDALLAKAVEGDDGKVYLEGSAEDVEKAAEFSVDAESDDTGSGGDQGADGDGATDVNKNVVLAKGLSDDQIEDELEDGGWDPDLSPKNSPVNRNARFTKGERPVPARPGARARVKKRYGDARDEAFGRGGGDDGDDGGDDRCMT